VLVCDTPAARFYASFADLAGYISCSSLLSSLYRMHFSPLSSLLSTSLVAFSLPLLLLTLAGLKLLVYAALSF